MDLSEIIYPGMSREETFFVEENQTAIQVGSGSSRVLATPWMIAFMERNAHRLLAQHLPAGQSSVGMHVDVSHLAPTPVGGSVRVRAEILAVDGLRVTFTVEAWDQVEKIGEGQHRRMVIDEERFLRRAARKRGDV
jgi:fluoroacetyl-CoA thioesterase